jgi:hypothetical protein
VVLDWGFSQFGELSQACKECLGESLRRTRCTERLRPAVVARQPDDISSPVIEGLPEPSTRCASIPRSSGMFNEMRCFNGVPATVESVLEHHGELGGPHTCGRDAAGRAMAGDTPRTLTKRVASRRGGTRSDLAAKDAAWLEEGQALLMKEAEKYDVSPTDDRTLERLDAALVGRPALTVTLPCLLR